MSASAALLMTQERPARARKVRVMRIARLVCWLLFAVGLLTIPAQSRAQVGVGISVHFGPPALPVYEQPLCPGDGYIWTPGYWAWDPDDGDYYWVPGTWVEPPEVGFLWTPGYWGWENGAFFFHEGYWGPHVGWYGGISYGFGYFGHGYEGGRWDHDHFYYNRSVNNVNVTEIHNVYNTTIVDRNENRASYNGGNGGINERPSREEESFSRERHIAPVSVQQQHAQEARGNRELRASVNQGNPLSPRRNARDHFGALTWLPRGRPEDAMSLQPIGVEMPPRLVPRTILIVRQTREAIPTVRPLVTPVKLLRTTGHLRRTRAIPSWIRNTSNSKTSSTPNRHKSIRSSSKNKSKTTSA